MLLCRCCGHNNSIKYLDLGEQPLANSYHKGEELKTYPLEVMLCQTCFLSYLSVVVDPDEMFRNYLYVSGTTHTLRKHWEELAADAVSRVGVGKVLDIACNDGAGLEQFKKLGCEVLGVDPALNLRELSKARGIEVVVDYWREGLISDDSFDVITAANVFAHVHDVRSFLEAAKKAIKTSGLIIIEFPYCKQTIEELQFDQVYHEHLSYFLVNPIYRLIENMNLRIVDILQTPIHGGSIRFFITKDQSKEHADIVFEMIRQEFDADLLSSSTYLAKAAQFSINMDKLAFVISDLRKKGNKVIGFGAAAKGNTTLNCAKLDLDYIVDDNSLKWDYMTPGRNIPIKSPAVLETEKEPLYIVILSWNFTEEICRKIRQRREGVGDSYAISYVPEVKIAKL